MDGEHGSERVALRQRREAVIEELSEAFAHDTLGLDDYEQRVTLAHRAAGIEELEALVADLHPVSARPRRAPREAATSALARLGGAGDGLAPSPTAPDTRAPETTFAAVFSAVERKGAWRPPHKLRALAVFGSIELDFRDVVLPPGVTELRLVCVLGGAHLIVPPALAVDCDGWAVFGGFQDLARAPAEPDPGAPLLRITGFALFGGIDIETRLPGEGAEDARRHARVGPQLGRGAHPALEAHERAASDPRHLNEH